jgi:tetratricopeptide (TPR) repeat protein
VYLAASVADLTVSPKDDLVHPFRFSYVAKNAGRAVTEAENAGAGVFSHFVFDPLPYGLTSGVRSTPAQKPEPRKVDLQLTESYQCEYRYVIYPPAFFRLQSSPADEEVKLGPAVFSRKVTNSDDGHMEVVFRFDSGDRRRLTTAEVEQFRDGLAKVFRETPEVFSFMSATSEALALGKERDAVGMVRADEEAHPKSAAAQARMARVLVAVGFGDAARIAARRAVELDPQSGLAGQALARAWMHDSFGRQFRGNWSVVEAEKALRKAIELEPENAAPQLDLALLLEYNDKAVRYGAGARMGEAGAIYRALLKKQENPAIRQNLAIALLRGGNQAEAKAELEYIKDGLKPTLSITMSALAGGAARAILDAQASIADPPTRASVFLMAGATLNQMRQYELGMELFKAAQRIQAQPEVQTRMAMMLKVKRYEETLFPPGDPRYPVQKIIVEMLAGSPDGARIESLVSKRVQHSKGNAVAQAELVRGLAGVKGMLARSALTPDGVLDVLLSLVDFEKRGDDSLAYLVEGVGLVPFPPFYVVKEDDSYRIIGSSTGLEVVGQLVLDAVKVNDLKTAQRWLDFIVNDGRVADNVRTVVLNVDPARLLSLRNLWAATNEKGRDAAAARLAAASLVGQFSASDEAISILRDARKRTGSQAMLAQIGVALCQALAKAERWSELLEAARDLGTNALFAGESFDFRVQARTALKQWSELEQDAVVRLKASAGDRKALEAALAAMIQAGNRTKAAAYSKQLMDLPFVGKKIGPRRRGMRSCPGKWMTRW